MEYAHVIYIIRYKYKLVVIIILKYIMILQNILNLTSTIAIKTNKGHIRYFPFFKYSKMSTPLIL